VAAPIPYISDQTVIQRYLTTKDEKATKKSLWVNAIMLVPATLIFFVLGTLFYMFYKNNPSSLEPGIDNDAIFPWFILSQLPAGMSGLLVAGIFAAAMSSLDSSMNSSSAAVINDFVMRFDNGMSPAKGLLYARLLTVFFGVFATVAALIMSIYDIKSLWDLCSRLLGLVGGGLCALFILAAFTKRTNTIGALTGVVVSVVSIFLIQEYTSLHFFLYSTASMVIACVTGYAVSLLRPGDFKRGAS
jgi:Na+/proline symporter